MGCPRSNDSKYKYFSLLPEVSPCLPGYSAIVHITHSRRVGDNFLKNLQQHNLSFFKVKNLEIVAIMAKTTAFKSPILINNLDCLCESENSLTCFKLAALSS